VIRGPPEHGRQPHARLTADGLKIAGQFGPSRDADTIRGSVRTPRARPRSTGTACG